MAGLLIWIPRGYADVAGRGCPAEPGQLHLTIVLAQDVGHADLLIDQASLGMPQPIGEGGDVESIAKHPAERVDEGVGHVGEGHAPGDVLPVAPGGGIGVPQGNGAHDGDAIDAIIALGRHLRRRDYHER